MPARDRIRSMSRAVFGVLGTPLCVGGWGRAWLSAEAVPRPLSLAELSIMARVVLIEPLIGRAPNQSYRNSADWSNERLSRLGAGLRAADIKAAEGIMAAVLP